MIGKELGRYLIVEALGEGGVAIVYKGYDRRLDRDVAIKVILPGHVHDEIFIKRFEREARAVAQLTHTNIVGVHDFGTHEGTSYLVMAYIPGGTMKDILGKPMPWQQAVRKISPIARALEYAHQKGIVHRDIKPSNILVTQSGDLMLTDFGIAKAVGSEEMTKITKTGTGIGTPAYMAPEQGMGEDIDHRADIYSLGIVFYEMITGQLPFKGDYEQAVIYSILNEEPIKVSDIQSEVTQEIERVISKALEKNPEKRFQKIEELMEDLRSQKINTEPELKKQQLGEKKPGRGKKIFLYGGITGLILIALTVVYIFLLPRTPIEDDKSIAVLPFKNMSEDQKNEYFCDGITEDIITQLSKIGDLKVTSRTSVFYFKDKKIKIKDIARELGVTNVMEGSVRQSGDRVRITAKLINTRTDTNL